MHIPSWTHLVVALLAAGISYGVSVPTGGSIFVVLITLLAALSRSIHLLGQDEQLRILTFSGAARVRNGPGACVLNPIGYRSAEARKVTQLGPLEYVTVLSTVTGEDRVEKGPQQLFLGAYEKLASGVRTALSATATEYIIVLDTATGERRVLHGPCVFTPNPQEEARSHYAVSLPNGESLLVCDNMTGKRHVVKGPIVWVPSHAYEVDEGRRKAIVLQSDQYIKLRNKHTGEKWIERGEQVIHLESNWEALTEVTKAFALKQFEYVRLMDQMTGKVSVHRGEQTVFPGADDVVVTSKSAAVDLKINEYLKVLDQSTGLIKVHRGAKLIFLEAQERIMGKGKQVAVEIDDDHAVLVRDKTSGQLRLETTKQLFFPGPDDVIEEVRDLIKLADHEAVIVKHKEGHFTFHYGSEEKRKGSNSPRSFFLPPHAELVTMWWSRGRRREIRDLAITRFDTRAQFMNFEFNCRTMDNVELILEGCFFWEVASLPDMIRTTADASGDICAHARSQFIHFVSRVTLKDFMNNLHSIGHKVHNTDNYFYEVRGLKVHSLEITRFQCAEASVSSVLEEIIQETTNRMNRLSQAESENEVAQFRMQGEIEQEKLNSTLLKIQNDHQREESVVDGKTEADRASTFLFGLKDEVATLAARIEMWRTLRKGQGLASISEGRAKFYYTPADASIHIESKEGY